MATTLEEIKSFLDEKNIKYRPHRWEKLYFNWI